MNLGISQEILDVVKQCVLDYPNDINKAAKIASQKIRKLKSFPQFENELIDRAIRGLINNNR